MSVVLLSRFVRVLQRGPMLNISISGRSWITAGLNRAALPTSLILGKAGRCALFDSDALCPPGEIATFDFSTAKDERCSRLSSVLASHSTSHLLTECVYCRHDGC